jgi:hypothetical protein
MDNKENVTKQNTPLSPQDRPKQSLGPTIGLIIILIIIVAGSFYFFGRNERFNLPETSDAPSIADIEDELLELQIQSDSDELEEIDRDLEATNLENLDAELELMEEELNQLEE